MPGTGEECLVSLINLWYYIKGYIIITVTGRRSERFINLAANRGILFWDIYFFDQVALMKVDIEGFRQLRPLARVTGCRVKIKQKVGIPFQFHKVAVRKGFLGGALFFVISLYLLSSFIWFIEVTGMENVSPQEIKETARESGLKVGVFKDSLDIPRVTHDLTVKIPDLSWVGLEIRGTGAHIKVVEKVKAPDPAGGRATHLVAARDGLVVEVLTISGRALVGEGDTVRAGDVLISGLVVPPGDGEGEPGDQGEAPGPAGEEGDYLVVARGTVMARVWYEGQGFSTLRQKRLVPAGDHAECKYIKVGDRKIYLQGDGRNPYPLARVQVNKRVPRWGGFRLPLEIVNMRFVEKKEVIQELTPEEAREEAREMAQQEARGQVSRGIEPVEEYFESLDTGDPQAYRVRYVIETLEDIARPQEVRPGREDYLGNHE